MNLKKTLLSICKLKDQIWDIFIYISDLRLLRTSDIYYILLNYILQILNELILTLSVEAYLLQLISIYYQDDGGNFDIHDKFQYCHYSVLGKLLNFLY